MSPTSRCSGLRGIPVAGVLAIVLAGGLAASVSLGLGSIGGEVLQRAGLGIKAPSRFLWHLRSMLNDRFGAYTGLSSGWYWISWDLLGQEPTWKVSIGRDGWLFLRSDGEIEDLRGHAPWTELHKRLWMDRLNEWCQVSRARGVPLVIAIAPNKSSMLSAHVRVDEVAPFERTRYGGLMSGRDAWSPELRQAMLDLHPIIEACCPEESYFKTDTHWNHHGAACAAEAITARLASLGIVRAEAPELSMREETVDGGDLARMLGAASRFSERISVPDRVPEIRTIEDLQRLPPPPSLPKSPSTPRVLVVHDSFGMTLRDPLSASLPGCVYEGGAPAGMTGLELSGLIERSLPDAVVVMFVERRLTASP